MRKKEKFKKFLLLLVVCIIAITQILYAKVSPKNKIVSDNNDIFVDNANMESSNNIEDFCIIEYKNLLQKLLNKNHMSSIQQFIDEYVVNYIGNGGEWYVILFYKMYGNNLDYSNYKLKLDTYIKNNKDNNITTKQLMALVYLCIDSQNEFLNNVCDETIGKYGIMSYIFGLHLLNNKLHSTKWTSELVIEKLLNMYDANKGYSFMGNDTDVDVISMVVQALAMHYENNNEVKNVIDNCINIISRNQQIDGGFINGNVNNSESISQVLLMASTMNIDIANDDRFIKNNKNIYDAMKNFKTSDGMYSHNLGGESNILATMQAFYAFGSMVLNKNNKENLFKINYGYLQ